jgi:carotenoid cleavage dioxygenase
MASGGLPRMDDRFTSLPYRWAYLGYFDPRHPNAPGPKDFPVSNMLGRFDMHTPGKIDSFNVPDGTLQEACFAPKAGSSEEGDGYLVAVINSLVQPRSELVVVDAKTMQQCARVIMPMRISEQVHGTWVSHSDLSF